MQHYNGDLLFDTADIKDAHSRMGDEAFIEYVSTVRIWFRPGALEYLETVLAGKDDDLLDYIKSDFSHEKDINLPTMVLDENLLRFAVTRFRGAKVTPPKKKRKKKKQRRG